MSFFSKIFKRSTFFGKFDGGTVEIVGNKIICKGNNESQGCEVSIEDIQYAYVVINHNGQSSLFLFDNRQNYLPTQFRGFKTVYQELTNKFKFNDKVFFDNADKKHELKKEIWRKENIQNYEILNSSYRDYETGFEIQSPLKDFINWDTTYAELEKNENAIFETSPYDQKILTFKYPVRIGNIVVNDFKSYFDNNRKDVAVLNYWAYCFDQFGTDKSYYDLKKLLKKEVPYIKNGDYERTDQKYLTFDLNGMYLSICYTYDSDWMFNCGYTSFAIQNNRTYPQLLLADETVEISSYIIFDGDIHIPTDYKRNEKIKNTPEKIADLFENKAVLWADKHNNKIGFSCNGFAQVYHNHEIKSFCIQNILPAKGSGGCYLELVLNDEKYNYSIFSGECYFFDAYAEKIKELTGKELVFGQEYHDC